MNGGNGSNGGGILRSTKHKRNDANGGSKGVRFSARDSDEDDMPPSRNYNRAPTQNSGDDYDSDDVDGAIMASGDRLSMMDGRRSSRDHESEFTSDDPAVHGSLEIEEAKRKRGRVRRNEDLDTSRRGGIADDDHTDNDNPTLSLITDHGANPDTYESNAGGNASCPVEPFNMNAEQEGGMGYFDGDTYVFRQNAKAIDGEEDAWLDGFKADDDDENEEEARGGGGLDSTAVWNPNSDDTKKPSVNRKQKDKFKYIDENATMESIGQRLVTLLQSDGETAMNALTRLGSQLREMQSKEQKLKKGKLSRKRKSKSKDTLDEGDSDKMSELSSQIQETRKIVEQLTELADALLFRGEADAYDLTKADWVHRFKLESHLSLASRKRPIDYGNDSHEVKKQRSYFDEANGDSTKQSESTQQVQDEQVMWEYKGNEDGAIHGPYTSKQMMDWTSCGYFVGDSAVDIRRVKSSIENNTEEKPKEPATAKTDVDDLMADLESDEEDNGDEEEKESSNVVNPESSWMRSDRVDFSLYI